MEEIQWPLLHQILVDPDCKERRPHAVFVYSPTCGTCKLGEQMLEIIHQTKPELCLYKLNLNTAPEAAELFQIRSIPCILQWEDPTLESAAPSLHYAMHSVTHLYSLFGGGHTG